jgi:glutamate/aspartate transport system substrate-binding protein
MGVRDSSAPLSYTLGNGRYTGYHVELCQRLLAQLLPQAAIRYQPVTSQNRIALVQGGTVDLECGSTSNTAARQQQVAFAHTTYITEARLAVRADSGIESVAQLQGRTVVTTTGTTVVQRLRKLERGGLRMDLVLAKDHADSMLMLESGRAAAFAMDDNTLAGNIANARHPADFRIVGAPLGQEPIAIMLRRSDAGFKRAVDARLAAMMASGELRSLYDKWFMQPIAPSGTALGLPFPPSLEAAFRAPNDRPAEDYEEAAPASAPLPASAPAPSPPVSMAVPISHSSASSAPEAISGEASSEAKRTVPSTARVAT